MIDNQMRIHVSRFSSCISRRGDSGTVVITVEDSCGPGQLQCRDGRCLPVSRFCDVRRDCSDGSDEDMPHCKRKFMRSMNWSNFQRIYRKNFRFLLIRRYSHRYA